MTIAGIMFESIGFQKNETDWGDSSFARIITYLWADEELIRELRDIESYHRNEKRLSDEKKILSSELKARIIEVNDFLKAKEEQCRILLQESEENLALQKSGFCKNKAHSVRIGYVLKSADMDSPWNYLYFFVETKTAAKDEDVTFEQSAARAGFVGDIPVCMFMNRFCRDTLRLSSYDIEQFMRLTKDFASTFERSFKLQVRYEFIEDI